MPIDWSVVQPYENKSLEEMLAQRSLAPEIQQMMQVAGLQQHGQEVEEQIEARKQAAIQHEKDLAQTRAQREAYQQEELANRKDALNRSAYSALTARLQPQVQAGVAPQLNSQEQQLIDTIEPGGYSMVPDPNDPTHHAMLAIYHQKEADIAAANKKAIDAQRKLEQDNINSEIASRNAEAKIRQNTEDRNQSLYDAKVKTINQQMESFTPAAQAEIRARMAAWTKANPAPDPNAWFGGETQGDWEKKRDQVFGQVQQDMRQNSLNINPAKAHIVPVPGFENKGGGTNPPPGGGGNNPAETPEQRQQRLQQKFGITLPGGATPPPPPPPKTGMNLPTPPIPGMDQGAPAPMGGIDPSMLMGAMSNG